MSPAPVETDRPVFCLRGLLGLGQMLGGELECEGRDSAEIAWGLEDGWFHQFDRGGGRWAAGLAKHHILAKIL